MNSDSKKNKNLKNDYLQILKSYFCFLKYKNKH